mmetsp:Transcript_44946/g.96550  ORF Transcript_44946/g.96550 Transcript_44946/m.96550 type:complete len:107 (+) Transcript_44946:369-689(+)
MHRISKKSKNYHNNIKLWEIWDSCCAARTSARVGGPRLAPSSHEFEPVRGEISRSAGADSRACKNTTNNMGHVTELLCSPTLNDKDGSQRHCWDPSPQIRLREGGR